VCSDVKTFKLLTEKYCIASKTIFNSWDYSFKEAREEEVNRSKEMHSDVYEDTILVEVEEDRSDHREGRAASKSPH
jgi:hypothetical protein